MANQTITPVSSNDRILYLDILRGIAILFIFLHNIPTFSGTVFYSDEKSLSFVTSSIDHFLEILAFILVDGKFYSIFSILFGIGYVVQYNSAMRSGKSFNPFFRRRMFGLLLIGSAHLFLIWLGDILTLYALLGFVLISFQNFDDKRLLKWAVILLLLPIVQWFFMYATGLYYPYLFYDIFDQYAASQGMILTDWMGVGIEMLDPMDYLALTQIDMVLSLNLAGPLIRLGDLLMDGRFFKVLALFLLGIWAGRQILDRNIHQNKSLLIKIAVWGFAIGLPMNIFRTIIKYSSLSGDFWTFISYVTHAGGVVPLACGYTAGIALIVLSRQRILGWFAPVGKMALSNYIFQSFIAIILFYGIGFGYAGSFGYSITVIIALAIFAWQIMFSMMWLKYFRFGPVEWLWRQMTYGKWIPNRIDTIPSIMKSDKIKPSNPDL